MAPPRKLYSSSGLTAKQLEIRDMAMADLKAFIALVDPLRVLGHCHHDLCDLLMTPDENQLVLWPRAHQKSAIVGYWSAWWIVKHPHTTILYASDTARVTEYQVSFIQRILESSIVRKYWPELINEKESQRTMWRTDAFSTDHWKRKEEGIRDPTLLGAGMGANLTGTHFDVLVLDDVVVYDNSEDQAERAKCETWFSLAASILNPGGFIKAVGTRYHPQDLYQKLIDMEIEVYDDNTGEVISTVPAFHVSQRVVERDGEFLWPRQRRSDGKWFGFDRAVLAAKRAKYLNKVQFYAQYYNDPSDPEGSFIDEFEYYERDILKQINNKWYVGSRPINIFAAIDFASSVSKKADYTCIVIVGIDPDHTVFILDIDRFKTDKISVMSERLSKLYDKWGWIKLRGEATAAQNLVVNQIKEYNRSRGIFYTIDIFKPTREKEVRIRTNLEPRYAEKKIVHYRGGFCQQLEDELRSERPPHDDIKDALASVMEIVVAPSKRRSMASNGPNVLYHPKFGGVY